MKLLATLVLGFLSAISGGTKEIKQRLPDDLEIGKTLRSDLDPSFKCEEDCMYFFGPSYEAHFDYSGFLDQVSFDREMNHSIPPKWEIGWDATQQQILDSFGSDYALETEEKNVAGSLTMESLTDMKVLANGREYHFYLITWKDAADKQDGLNRVMVKLPST